MRESNEVGTSNERLEILTIQIHRAMILMTRTGMKFLLGFDFRSNARAKGAESSYSLDCRFERAAMPRGRLS
jgi:hypothetical protein